MANLALTKSNKTCAVMPWYFVVTLELPGNQQTPGISVGQKLWFLYVLKKRGSIFISEL